jgi:fumarate reductase flavoprotein subunit
VLEEGLRGAGGYLVNGAGERFMQGYDSRGERATRDIVSRAIFSEIRAGRTTPNGGVYIQMSHLGPENVRRQFKGMVERCADCGFDLAGGRVEVVPTAHYMMGGVIFGPDCRTALPGLFVAGEDSGGVHGANRLGGNGVANSTVFGGVAGDTMAAWVRSAGAALLEPDPDALEAARAGCEHPFRQAGGDLGVVRERLYDTMWDDAGILRTEPGLRRAKQQLAELGQQLQATGVATTDRAFNLTWHDWLNLRSLIFVSRAITAAALARADSCGAHFREDFPQPTDPMAEAFTCVSWTNEQFTVTREPVAFTRVGPGASLLTA